MKDEWKLLAVHVYEISFQVAMLCNNVTVCT